MYVIGGEFIENIETTEIAYFSIDEIPDNLAEEKTNKCSLERGNCILKFKNEKFYIIQNENQIENDCINIYELRTWIYQNGLYMAIMMRSHVEYKFSLVEPKENNELAISLMSKFIERIANKLKVKFNDCGESEE